MLAHRGGLELHRFLNFGTRYGGERHAPASLPPGTVRYPLYRRLSGPHCRSQPVRKTSPPPGIDPRTVETVAGRYTD
jgi:hypothetical protein